MTEQDVRLTPTGQLVQAVLQAAPDTAPRSDLVHDVLEAIEDAHAALADILPSYINGVALAVRNHTPDATRHQHRTRNGLRRLGALTATDLDALALTQQQLMLTAKARAAEFRALAAACRREKVTNVAGLSVEAVSGGPDE